MGPTAGADSRSAAAAASPPPCRIRVGTALDIVATQCQRRGLLHASNYLTELSVHATPEVRLADLGVEADGSPTPYATLPSAPPRAPVHTAEATKEAKKEEEEPQGETNASGASAGVASPRRRPGNKVVLRPQPWPLVSLALDDDLFGPRPAPSDPNAWWVPFESVVPSAAASPRWRLPKDEDPPPSSFGSPLSSPPFRGGMEAEEWSRLFVRYHCLSLNLLQQQAYSRCHHVLSNLWKQVKNGGTLAWTNPSVGQEKEEEEKDHSLSSSLLSPPPPSASSSFPSCLQFIRLYAWYLEGEKMRMTNRTRSHAIDMSGGGGGGGAGNPHTTSSGGGGTLDGGGGATAAGVLPAASSSSTSFPPGGANTSPSVTSSFLGAGGLYGAGEVQSEMSVLNPHLRELRVMLQEALRLETTPNGMKEAKNEKPEEDVEGGKRRMMGATSTTSTSSSTASSTSSSSAAASPVRPPSSVDVANSSRHRPDAFLLWLMGVVLRGLHAPPKEYISYFMASIIVNPLFSSAWEDLGKSVRSEADVVTAQCHLSGLRPAFMLDIFVATARTALGMRPTGLSMHTLATASAAAMVARHQQKLLGKLTRDTQEGESGGSGGVRGSGRGHAARRLVDTFAAASEREEGWMEVDRSPSPLSSSSPPRGAAASRESVSPEAHQNTWELLLAQFPYHPFLMTQLAEETYYVEKDAHRAEKILSLIQQQDPYRLAHTPLYSNLLFLKPDLVGLCNLAQKVYRTDPYSAEANLVVGNYHSSIHAYEQAIFYFRRALMVDATLSTGWTLLGQAYLEHKNIQAALNAFRCAVELDPRDYRGWYNLGHSYELLSVYHRARYYYSKAAQLRPSDARMWRAMASCFRKEQKEWMALECLERAEACEEPLYLPWLLSKSMPLALPSSIRLPGRAPPTSSPRGGGGGVESQRWMYGARVSTHRRGMLPGEVRGLATAVPTTTTTTPMEGGNLSGDAFSSSSSDPASSSLHARHSPSPVYYASFSPRSAAKVLSMLPSPPPSPSAEYLIIVQDLADYYCSSGKSLVGLHNDLFIAYRFLHRGALYYYKLFMVLGGMQSSYLEPIALYMVETLLCCADVLLHIKCKTLAANMASAARTAVVAAAASAAVANTAPSPAAPVSAPFLYYPAATPMPHGVGSRGMRMKAGVASTPPRYATAAPFPPSALLAETPSPLPPPPPPPPLAGLPAYRPEVLQNFTMEELEEVVWLLNGAEEWLRTLLIEEAFYDLPAFPSVHPTTWNEDGDASHKSEIPAPGDGRHRLMKPLLSETAEEEVPVEEGKASPEDRKEKSPQDHRSPPLPTPSSPALPVSPSETSLSMAPRTDGRAMKRGGRGRASPPHRSGMSPAVPRPHPVTVPSASFPSSTVSTTPGPLGMADPLPFPSLRNTGAAPPLPPPPPLLHHPPPQYLPPPPMVFPESSLYPSLVRRKEKLQQLFRLAENECS